jgi:hypothetical protein
MTAGCRGCISVNRGGQAVNHSEACRNGIGEELVKKGDARVMREKERWEEELTGALKEEERNVVKERSEEEERAREERLFGDIVMELSKPVERWNSEAEVMKKKIEEENLFWGDLDELRHGGHVVGKKYWDDL